jgi:hypothetical protein
MKGFLIFVALLGMTFSSITFSQETTLIEQREDTLSMLLTSLRSFQKDKQKDSANSIFKAYLRKTLDLPEAFSYSFSKLNTVGFVDSPDGEVRIVNWNIEQQDQTQKYHCFVLKKTKSGISVSELIENPETSPRPDGILEAGNWYGALYYKIIPKEKGSKKMYVVLGWDGNNSASTIKLIDVLYFAGSTPKLGSPVFKLNGTTAKRIFFEHSKKVSISVKYEPEYDRIIYDHLSPETPALAGFYSFYVPDLSYDALYFKDNKWILKEDVIGVNKSDGEKKEVYIKNERSGKIEKVEIKDKWESPEDASAPAGGSEHKAVLPDSEVKEEEKKKEELEKKVDKKDKRDPNSLNTTVGSGRSGRKHRNN